MQFDDLTKPFTDIQKEQSFHILQDYLIQCVN